jgi:hypothetical protein
MRECDWCGARLPDGSHPTRRYCTRSCRQRRAEWRDRYAAAPPGERALLDQAEAGTALMRRLAVSQPELFALAEGIGSRHG